MVKGLVQRLKAVYSSNETPTQTATLVHNTGDLNDATKRVINEHIATVMQAQVGLTQKNIMILHADQQRVMHNLLQDQHARFLTKTIEQISKIHQRPAAKPAANQIKWPKCLMILHYHHLCVARILAKTGGSEIKKFVKRYQNEQAPFFD